MFLKQVCCFKLLTFTLGFVSQFRKLNLNIFNADLHHHIGKILQFPSPGDLGLNSDWGISKMSLVCTSLETISWGKRRRPETPASECQANRPQGFLLPPVFFPEHILLGAGAGPATMDYCMTVFCLLCANLQRVNSLVKYLCKSHLLTVNVDLSKLRHWASLVLLHNVTYQLGGLRDQSHRSPVPGVPLQKRILRSVRNAPFWKKNLACGWHNGKSFCHEKMPTFCRKEFSKNVFGKMKSISTKP